MKKEDLIIDDSEMMKKLEESQKKINDKIDKISKEIYEEYGEYLEQKETDEEYLENDGPLDDTEFFKKLHKIQKEFDEELEKQFQKRCEEYSDVLE